MNTISTLKYKIDLQELVEEYTTLSRNGGKIPRGTCPICHGDNPTEFCILGDRYYCHKCGSSGDVIGFYAEVEGLPFYQAVEALAEKYEVSTDDPVYQKQKSIVGQNTKIAIKYHKAVDAVREYMNVKRGINDDTLEDFLIGYDKGGFLGVQSSGIVIPIQDAYGRIVGFPREDWKKQMNQNTRIPKKTMCSSNGNCCLTIIVRLKCCIRMVYFMLPRVILMSCPHTNRVFHVLGILADDSQKTRLVCSGNYKSDTTVILRLHWRLIIQSVMRLVVKHC